MKILSFDTTNSLASVAIMVDNKLLSYFVTEESSSQAEKLFYLINKSLKETGLLLDDIDLVSVTNGPGSFTGVRIGLAAALGMRMSSRAKFIALSNFQVLAYQLKEQNKDIAVALDARRGQIYLQLFNSKLENISEPSFISIEDLSIDKDMLIIGDGIKQANESLMINADAALLCKASEFYFSRNMYSDITPLYIREADVGNISIK
jgi:tRNA threonylcarbamoyladenosine biosynthesis protein TsaB